jgi:hypothetical protein
LFPRVVRLDIFPLVDELGLGRGQVLTWCLSCATHQQAPGSEVLLRATAAIITTIDRKASF